MISCVLISDATSYFLFTSCSTFCFLASISNSFEVNFLVISSNWACFSASSFSNFSLFWFSPTFLSCFCFFSSSNSSIFSVISVISSSKRFAFCSLFTFLSCITLISELIFSILFELSKPIFCICSIFSVISSTCAFSSSFNCFTFSNFSFSSSYWFLNISSSFIISSNFVLYVSMLYINKPTSMPFNSSLKSKNFFAFSDWILSGSMFPSISVKMSFIRSKFNLVCSNFFSVSSFLVLYFTIPAASSKIRRLSSDLLLNISSILPCPIIEYPSFPIPVSINSSNISFNLQGVLFIKYPVSPLL